MTIEQTLFSAVARLDEAKNLLLQSAARVSPDPQGTVALMAANVAIAAAITPLLEATELSIAAVDRMRSLAESPRPRRRCRAKA